MTEAALRGYRSRTLATWLAVLGGAVGLHRFYLHGLRDPWGWLALPFTLAGLVGIERMRLLGADDRLAWVLIPLLGITIVAGMFAALVYGLMPAERWQRRHDPNGALQPMHVGTVLGVAAALVLGCGVLMATIAFAAQRYFESRVVAAWSAPQGSSARPTQ